MLDEMALISFEVREENPDSNVRFCLGVAWDAG